PLRLHASRPHRQSFPTRRSSDLGVRIQPRVVVAGDENRLTGYAGLPITLNPYLPTFDRLEPVVGAILPAPGAYDVVFDTTSRLRDRKSTRLNSSHQIIPYAVFCL